MWSSLSESVVEAESVNAFKNRLDGEWHRPGWLDMGTQVGNT